MDLIENFREYLEEIGLDKYPIYDKTNTYWSDELYDKVFFSDMIGEFMLKQHILEFHSIIKSVEMDDYSMFFCQESHTKGCWLLFSNSKGINTHLFYPITSEEDFKRLTVEITPEESILFKGDVGDYNFYIESFKDDDTYTNYVNVYKNKELYTSFDGNIDEIVDGLLTLKYK